MNQLRAGAVLSYISIFISIIIALVYTPIMIRLLGQSEFGLYSLIGSLAAYFSVLDLGLGNAIVRYTARNRAKGDKEFESRLNGTFLMLFSIIGILTVLIGIIVYSNIEFIFGSSLAESEIDKAKIMIVVLIINFSLSFPLSVFQSIIRAYERFVVDKLISITRIVMAPVLILPLLLFGYGSISMVVTTTIVNLSTLLYATYYAFSHLGIKVSFNRVDNTVIKEIFGYSFFIFLNIIVDQIFWKTDQIILGIVSGTISVAIFAIGMQFITLYMQFSTAIANLFLPRLSMMEANNASNEEFSNVMIKYGRIQFILIAYILSGFIVFGQYFINFWAGPDYSPAYYIVLAMMVPLTIPLTQNIGIAILQAKNKLAFRSTLYIILAILNVLITIPLAIRYDGIGTALATGISLIVGHIIIMNIYYYRYIGLDIPRYWSNILKLMAPVLLSAGIGLYFIKVIFPISSVIQFILGIIIFSLLYLFLNWIFGMNKSEKELFLSMLGNLMNRLRF